MLHRTIIVPKAKQALSQSLCAGLAGNAGAGMFVVGLSATGSAPATHTISAGPIGDDFASLLPLTTVATGSSHSATVNDTPLPSGSVEYIGVKPGDKLAVIAAA